MLNITKKQPHCKATILDNIDKLIFKDLKDLKKKSELPVFTNVTPLHCWIRVHWRAWRWTIRWVWPWRAAPCPCWWSQRCSHTSSRAAAVVSWSAAGPSQTDHWRSGWCRSMTHTLQSPQGTNMWGLGDSTGTSSVNSVSIRYKYMHITLSFTANLSKQHHQVCDVKLNELAIMLFITHDQLQSSLGQPSSLW